ncbi:MAG TPA: thioredoxin family protein [Symbiobacteriaceae bacterium]|jgi:small redox-active disulfide protein 2
MGSMVVKILGTGCANCVRLEQNAREALTRGAISAEVVKVTDVPEIMEYGILRTPGLVVNEKVLVSGRVPDTDEVLRLFMNELAAQA